MHIRTIITLILLIFISGCATSKISSVSGNAPSHAVNSIAISPSGGLIADAIAVELFNRGFSVIDTSQTSNLLLRLGIREVEVTSPQNLTTLRNEGIDAYLVARSADGEDGLPQSASVRVNSTHTGQILAGVSWQNGWGGQSGSIADRTMRKDLTEAAEQIANEIASALNH